MSGNDGGFPAAGMQWGEVVCSQNAVGGGFLQIPMVVRAPITVGDFQLMLACLTEKITPLDQSSS